MFDSITHVMLHRDPAQVEMSRYEDPAACATDKYKNRFPDSVSGVMILLGVKI